MAWDGIKGPTWTPEHRAACEIRTLLTWSKERRTAYYAQVAERRGKPAAIELVDAVNAARRAANDPARA